MIRMLNDHPYVKIVAVWLFTLLAVGVIFTVIASAMGMNNSDVDRTVMSWIRIYLSVAISMALSSFYASSLGVSWIIPLPAVGPLKAIAFTALTALASIPAVIIVVIIDLMVEFNSVDLFPYWIAFIISLIISIVFIIICRKYIPRMKLTFISE